MVMTADGTSSYLELGPLIAKAAREARQKQIRMQVIEVEMGRFKIILGNPAWTPKLRAYIDYDGTITESFFAARKGFSLPPGSRA